MREFKDRALAIARRKWPLAAGVDLPDEALDRLVDEATGAIMAGRGDVLGRLFDRVFDPQPTLVWDPGGEILRDRPRHAFLQRYWHERRGGRELPLSTTIDPIDLAPVLGYVMLMQPLDGGQDFRYRLYGTVIAQYSGLELTGRRVSDVPLPLVGLYFLATYRAAYLARRPLFAHHRTHHDIQVAEWTRLILPFADASGAVDRLLVANVPSLHVGKA